LLAVWNSLFNILAAGHLAYMEAVSSTHNLGLHCAMVTGTHLTWGVIFQGYNCFLKRRILPKIFSPIPISTLHFRFKFIFLHLGISILHAVFLRSRYWCSGWIDIVLISVLCWNTLLLDPNIYEIKWNEKKYLFLHDND
jgi:hypothetical protein